MDTLCVRVAQVVSIHDHQLRELRTLLRRVRLPTSGRVGKELAQLDKERSETEAARTAAAAAGTDPPAEHPSASSLDLSRRTRRRAPRRSRRPSWIRSRA